MENVKSLKTNDKVLVQLRSGQFIEGIFNGAHQSSIELLVKKGKIPHRQVFYFVEIKTIRLDEPTRSLSTPPTQKDDVCDSVHVNRNQNNVIPVKAVRIEKKLLVHEIKQIQSNIDNLVYIRQFDMAYFDAIKNLKKQEFIGVGTQGVPFGRLTMSSPILICSTFNTIYIFDMMTLQEMPDEFRLVFSLDVPRKVCHDSRTLADYLKSKQNCDLNGIFDTQVAHCLIRKRQELLSVHELLEIYFDEPVDPGDPGNTIKWDQRPLLVDDKKVAAYNVAYLIKLYVRMVFEDLYGHLLSECDAYSKTYSQQTIKLNE